MPKYLVHGHAIIPMSIEIEAATAEDAIYLADVAKLPEFCHDPFIYNGKDGRWKMDALSIEPMPEENYRIEDAA